MTVTRWAIDPERSEVRVRAQATLHGSESRGGGVTGEVFGDLDALETTAGGTVVVSVGEQRFGNRVQDFAMARHLDVKRHPEARFEVEGVRVSARDPWRVTVRGRVHYRDDAPLEVEAEGTLDEHGLRASATFPLSLSAIGVKAPRLGFLKVQDEVEVSVTLVGRAT